MSISKSYNNQTEFLSHPEIGNEFQDLLEYNLSLSFEERLLNHQRALDTINELIKARKQIYGELESSSQTPS